MASSAQLAKLRALCRERDFNTTDLHEWSENSYGRTIRSLDDLASDEASELIEYLEND